MSDRGIYAEIDRIIRAGKRRLDAADRDLINQLLAAYQDARHTVMAELTLLEQQILWSIEAQEDHLTAAWMRRQAWYQQLDQTIQREADRLEDKVRNLTTLAREAGIAQGVVTGSATVSAVPWGTFNSRAVEHWISAIQPGSPLDRVLSRYGLDVETSLRNEITQGLIRGRGSRNTVSAILADVGEVIEPFKASRIVRTEMMRAYRGVFEEQMGAFPRHMIAGYQWMSALDMRTCPICLGLHGQVFEDYPDFAHVNCRCVVVPVFGERYAPPREIVTGDQWFSQQSPEYQRAVLGPGRSDVYSEGTPLAGMIRFDKDPVWGGTPRLITLKELRR